MRQSVQTRKDETAAERRSSAEQCGRYGIDIRGFRLHMEVDDLEAILASIEGIEGIVSVVDRRTRGRTFFGTVDQVRNAILSSLRTKRSHDDVSAGSERERV